MAFFGLFTTLVLVVVEALAVASAFGG